MSDDEDLELAALQRQLDDAFETTRPRAGYEDELWLRMQSRRPFWVRLRDGMGALVNGVREVPAVPAATVAVVLVLAIGIGVVSLSGVHMGGGGATTALAPDESARGGTQFGSAAGGAGAFGRLPAPVLQSGLTPADDGAPNPKSTGPEAGLYQGPATLVWAGTLDVKIASAPVYRYQEPSAAAADQFAASLGAARAGTPPPGYIASYAGEGFDLNVRGSVSTPSGEPFYILAPSPPATAVGATPSEIASSYLASHSLVPTWPHKVVVDQAGDTTRVRYQRIFQVPGAGDAYAIDGLGSRYGLEVDVKGGRVQSVAGPIPIALDVAAYPIISGDEAVRSALGSRPAGPQTSTPPPTVRLTSAELVYALAWAGDHSFYEPAFLFSGNLTFNGTTYVKRVLVPAVIPSQRSS